MTLKDWIGTPHEWGAYGMRMTSWLNELVSEVRSNTESVTTNAANIATNAADITSLTSGTITYAPNVADLGFGFQGAQAHKTKTTMVHIYGVINNNSGGVIAAGTALIQFPSGYRPAATTIINVTTALSGGVIRADINTLGQLYLQGGWAVGDFLAFNASYKAA